MSGADTTGRDEDDAVVRPRPAPARPEGLARLAASVARMPPPVFAIVDGGHFDDLPSDLSGAGLLARSLFLGHGERDVERHGPWFVTVRGERDMGAVLGIVGDLPALVFWSCPAGDMALYGHLRRLNMARIPAWAAAGKAGPEPGVEADRGYEAVLFRHWDPRVLGALLPVLDEAQFSCIVGPAGEIVFYTEDHGGTKRVVADPEWPLAASGMLTIRPEQIEALTERRATARRERVGAYLRDVTGHELDGASAAEVQRHVLHSEATGRDLGLVTEAGHCRWAYLMYVTDGEAARRPEVTGFIKSGFQAPDAQLADVVGEAIRHLERSQAQLHPGVGF